MKVKDTAPTYYIWHLLFCLKTPHNTYSSRHVQPPSFFIVLNLWTEACNKIKHSFDFGSLFWGLFLNYVSSLPCSTWPLRKKKSVSFSMTVNEGAMDFPRYLKFSCGSCKPQTVVGYFSQRGSASSSGGFMDRLYKMIIWWMGHLPYPISYLNQLFQTGIR